MMTLDIKTVPRRLAAAAIALCLAAACWVTGAQAAIGLTGAAAPDFVLKSLAGPNVRLSEHRGEVVLVSFWAKWCGECRAQLAQLNEWHAVYEGAGLRLLAISLDRRWADMRDTAQSLKLAYPVLHDAELDVSARYAIGDLPAWVLIDRDGVVTDVFEGYERGREAEVLERVKARLRE